MKKVIFITLSLMIFLFLSKITFSIECSLDQLESNKSTEFAAQVKERCQQVINESSKKMYDAEAQIHSMDAKIYLTLIQIQETEQKITNTEKQIETLTSRIDGLDSSLNYLSRLLLERIVEGYKKRDVSVFSLFFDTENANEFINRLKYLKTAQDNNQKLLVQVQQAKLNYEDQKKLREKKKLELDDLKVSLNGQKNTLNLQRTQQQKLIDDIKNDLQMFQRVLALAEQQSTAFKSFVQTSGVDTVIAPDSLGTGFDGVYYSQRDSRWAYKTIGYSSENILNVGCLLTSVAMVAKKYGQNTTPLDIASDVNRFYGFTAYMSLPWKSVAGKSYYGGVNVDEELQNGNYVIVGVGSCGGYGGSHFIVLTKKEGNDYIMHDPIYGPDLKLTSHYSSYFCSTATFK